MRRAAWVRRPTPCDRPVRRRVAPRSVARRVARLRWRRARRGEGVGAEEGAEGAGAAPTALGEASRTKLRTAARAAPVAEDGPAEADAVRVEGLVARAGAEEEEALVVGAAAEHAGVDAWHSGRMQHPFAKGAPEPTPTLSTSSTPYTLAPTSLSPFIIRHALDILDTLHPLLSFGECTRPTTNKRRGCITLRFWTTVPMIRHWIENKVGARVEGVEGVE
jgi:hypothetical protein